jgi:hypothetical protein
MQAMNERTVLLYGRSLLLSGVAASLEQSAGLRTAQAATWVEASQLICEHAPDVLIFDLMSSNESHVLSLLLTYPSLLIIGLDSECSRAVLVSGQEARSLTVNQIAEMVRREEAALRQ